MTKISTSTKPFFLGVAAAHLFHFPANEEKQVLEASRYDPPQLICEVVQLRRTCSQRETAVNSCSVNVSVQTAAAENAHRAW